MQFQLWCNAACADYYYGTMCYAVCYRMLCCSPGGAWCATCFAYIQPHGNLTQIKTTCSDCHTITFPCSCQWQVMACCVTLSWTDSGISAGQTLICCVCQAQTVAALICNSGCCACGCSLTCTSSFTRPDNWTADCGGGWTLYCTLNCSAPTHSWEMCVYLPAGNNPGFNSCTCVCFNGVAAYGCYNFSPCCVSGSGTIATAAGCCLCWWITHPYLVPSSFCAQWCINYGQCCRTKCWCCSYCSGQIAGCCTLETFYGTTDTLSTQCILDGGTGCLNWLATSYL